MILYFWPACTVCFLLMVLWIAIFDGIESTKENYASIAAMSLFGPITLTAIFGVMLNEYYITRKRKTCGAIMTRWEQRGRGRTLSSNWDWYMNSAAQEERFNQLRETIRELSDKELDTLASVSKNAYDLDKPIREAVIDEMLERKILSHDE